MNALVQYHAAPIVRSNLDFKLADVPRYWFAGDPFLTRMFDALSLTFPDGERYFIQSVRLFRDQIQDPDLKQRVADFIRQEAQHGIAHDKMNQVMKDQGMPVDQFIQRLNKVFKFELKYRSPQYNIAMTAAAEHLTALMAETFYGEKDTLQDAHPYVRALFAWHAIEEMEHRDVAFDVMQQVGNVPEVTRKMALVLTTGLMFGFTLYRANVMLRCDGFNRTQRLKMNVRGLQWLFGKQGKLRKMQSQYRDWFKPDFHPSQHPIIAQYDVWLETLAQTGDPIQAGEAFWQAGK
ncbi:MULTISPECIES: metal-dependent hydrolase [Acinetobacter]|jgi:predicted metal-dependent hydrolase|uniref:Metal-dependent hydrolase n=1 Tax=Acinetobacter towneri TaxID=202956 RepID=A0AAP9KJR0_9GAMM|nr:MULTISPECIES: metal-dependent hydrolase [Acinetobacter]MCA4790959.1 metal-dependent hydrolase [Acinetobacter towneri]MCA4799281.1 metal-dependent hydrolase [Acinetobacter towneri]MCO8060252.1 metal-dependent hydrolase [Acinetobacter towneri]MCO8065893.1 metal-dependent hydrolase [Acinetobacter towneri]NWK53589.1 metal-dependent hydrolase [Acinetobacter sp. SwsAc5]